MQAFAYEQYEQEVRTITADMAEKIHTAGKKTIAVVDFTDLQGNVTELGRFLAEEVSIALADTQKGFEVVDRSNLASILKEHKLAASGLIDPQTAKKLGQIAGVEALVTATLTPFGDSVRVSLKVLDTETAKMIGSSRGNITKNATIQELLAKGISAEGGAQPASGGSAGKASAAKSTNADSHLTSEAQKFIFELQGCELSGQSLECVVLIQNNGKDRDLIIQGASRLFDDQGSEYRVMNAEIADTNQQFSYPSQYIRKTLLYGVPVRANLIFHGISPQATRVSSLTLYCGTSDDVQFPVAFRNVSMDQKSIGAIDKNQISNGGAPGVNGGNPVVNGLKDEAGKILKDTAKGLLKGLIRKVVPVPIPTGPDGQ
jgi:TolB-like protein